MVDRPRFGWPHAVAALAFIGIGWAVSTYGPIQVVRVPIIHRVTTVDTVYHAKPTVVRGPARLIYRTVPPDTVYTTLPGKVDTLVRAFCAITADTAAPRHLVLTAGTIGRTDARLWGFTNDGRAYQGHWNLKPPYSFTTNGDSVEVSQARLRFHLPSFGQVLGCAAIGGGAAFVGSKVF